MPEKTVEAWRNLWFHTGDALRRDEDGWYYFIDRYKDALRRRGENISSYEVEQAILGHAAVVECAVIGVPADIEAGEDEVLAVVVAAAAGRRRRDLGLVRGPHPRVRHPAIRALRSTRCRRRRRRRSARPRCATTASPPTPTTAPAAGLQPDHGEHAVTTTRPRRRVHPMRDWVPETRTLLIGGGPAEPEGEHWDVLQPGDRRGPGHRARGASADQVDDAVAAARDAFPAWSALSGEERARHIHRLADVLEAAADRLLPSIVNEVGTPVVAG